jgi:hypothetical protein
MNQSSNAAFYTQDGGATWIQGGSYPSNRVSTFALTGSRSAVLVNATIGGGPYGGTELCTTADAGGTWSCRRETPVDRDSAGVVAAAGSTLWIALQKSDSEFVFGTSADGGRTWRTSGATT